MELRHLRYFIAAGDEEHFGRAAEKLRLAQPALSRQLRDLEEEMGVQLFERLKRGVRLSSAGKVFLVKARHIIDETQRAVGEAQRVAQGREGVLRISFIESAAWHGVVPDSFKLFRERHPSAELQLTPLSSLEQFEGILAERYDAGYLYHLPEDDDQLGHVTVLKSRVELAVSKNHRLAEFKSIKLKALRDEAFVWFPRRVSPVYYDRLRAACDAGGIPSPKIVQEAINDATVLSLVSCGIGISFINSTTRWRCPTDVRIIPVTDLRLPLHLMLAWRKDNRSPLLDHFKPLARTAAAAQAMI